MVETIIKEVDSQGRISIPAHWRKEWKSNKLILKKQKNKIELIPIEPAPPSRLFDSVEIPSNVDFTDPYSLRKVLIELHES